MFGDDLGTGGRLSHYDLSARRQEYQTAGVPLTAELDKMMQLCTRKQAGTVIETRDAWIPVGDVYGPDSEVRPMDLTAEIQSRSPTPLGAAQPSVKSETAASIDHLYRSACLYAQTPVVRIECVQAK